MCGYQVEKNTRYRGLIIKTLKLLLKIFRFMEMAPLNMAEIKKIVNFDMKWPIRIAITQTHFYCHG